MQGFHNDISVARFSFRFLLFVCQKLFWHNNFNHIKSTSVQATAHSHGKPRKVKLIMIQNTMLCTYSSGIRQHIDHLMYLGIDAVILSRVLESSFLDFGSDVTNFTKIDPVYGTLQEFKELVNDFHERGKRQHNFLHIQFKNALFIIQKCT